MSLTVSNPAYLQADQVVIAHRFESYVREYLPRLEGMYRAIPESHGGKWINSDIANLLSPDFALGAVPFRWRHSDSVRSTAAAVSLYLVDQAAKRPFEGPRHFVALFGPPGSGKTSSGIRELPCDHVFEWTFGNLDSARRLFAKILKQRHLLTVIGVFVDPMEAIRRVIARVQKDGRAQSIDWMVRSYTLALDNLLAIRKDFGEDAQYRFIENDHEPRLLPSDSVDWMCRFRYAEKRDELRDLLHKELRRNKLPAALYAAMRPYPPGTGGPCG